VPRSPLRWSTPSSRMLRRALALMLALCWASPGFAQPQPAPELVLELEAGALVARGASPNAEVAFFGVAKAIEHYSATVFRRHEVVADADGDGEVRWELDREIPTASVWVAVDLASGKLALAAPPLSPYGELALPESGVGRGEGGRPDWVELDGRVSLDLFLARPGNPGTDRGIDRGAWAVRVGDGGPDDDDGESDRRLVTSLARLLPVSGSPGSPGAPGHLAAGDVLVLVDPDRMEIAVRTIGGDSR
jgi:hypothetical protein